jgi:peptide/nickel transport system substrate-binding protein
MRRLRIIALLALIGLLVAACGGSAEDTSSTTASGDDTATTTAATEPSETTTATEPAGEFVGDMVAAPDCDYGGKISSIEAVDALTVKFTLCSPVPAFQQIVAFTPFGIQPEEHLEATGGSPLENPIGTGPWALEAWNRGDSVVFTKNADYWGEPAPYDTLVFRWATESASRLVELQSGNADMITNLSKDDIPAVEADPNLTLLPVQNPNVFYLGLSTKFEPLDNVDVRKAIAMGIDRQRIVDNFYPPGSTPADFFTPCAIENACNGEAWYGFDAAAGKQMLADAGFPDGFDTTIYYRDVFRVYLPEPGSVALEIAEQLRENLGINANVQVVESGEFIATSTVGDYPIYLLGWGADYPHVTNFLDFHFGEANPQFGDVHPEIYDNLIEGAQIADSATAAPIYEAANNAIRDIVPMVPIAHGAANDAALVSVENAAIPVFGAPFFHEMNPGKDTFVFVQNAEPISLYCSDETDGESLSACQQVVEPLLDYDLDGNVVPALATECVANDDATEWTCSLREGVTFHDGSSFDANDVVASLAAGIDAANPLHVGNTGVFDYYAYLWGQLINAPESEG